MVGYSDADWCGDKIDRMSTYMLCVHVTRSTYFLSFKKQSIAALSSCEDEYVAGSSVTCQAN